MSASSIYVGEGLAGEGNEIAHIDLMLGDKDGPMGGVFGSTLSRQSEGHTNLLAVLAPNKAVKPDTVTFTKVTIKGLPQALQMFGPAQAAVAWAVGDALVAGEFEALGDPNQLQIVVGVFIHPQAADNGKILQFNYEATRMAIQAATGGKPSLDDVKNWVKALETNEADVAHPFRGDGVKLGEIIMEARKKFVKK